MRAKLWRGVVCGVLAAVVQIGSAIDIAFAQRPSLNRPGATNRGFGSPGLPQAPMRVGGSAAAVGGTRAQAYTGGVQRSGNSGLTSRGSAARTRNVTGRVGGRTSESIRQNVKANGRRMPMVGF
jgi:hypothetical protein